MQTILASALPTGVSTLRPAPAAVVQAGAICYRRARATDGYDVLLISGRSTGRWGIPKGHLEAGETTKGAAAREAFEEAGVVGVATEHSVGGFTYSKDDDALVYRVRVHLIAVRAIASDYPERSVRSSRWVPASIAAYEVGQPGLRNLLVRILG
ncbi:NUDIX domain-containing protein (plasmid) [Ensifer adhaerens]|uniref:NUDIX hydrolase n=1 Tax=Ensifer adhaerens TaxID=106592 RepID=UPI001CBF3312|nr:NUDIX domain-containing protein [Ensifer adhaerens]MBZ7927547.1 NUDIX domain-containing protein [Ensifer adhaerens]UAX97962.1 NUDIX domain-containing protein [Ensifer adhaerens]UAY05341.1 NUDIX domain-containing protein [Ensifer adhaerens]UAY12719.1 NUDIX domain-containing protein [Ensifer adhaerens]